ncbi:DNA ligase D [Methylibium rhizosphaerae]|uniref:DNA ligase D n=1 Tax=Methylibium rhizosphaerae TaxID=2570323 RepID=UPI001129D2AD|nr:DNA ligase D [Methylibium rhizosphaerae]
MPAASGPRKGAAEAAPPKSGATPRRGGSAPLERYNAKRNFNVTSEPVGRPARRRSKALDFVIQKHWASRLHYDFRLELDGVMLSWAVPKGPSYDPAVKSMAIQVEDHPLSYNSFEGTIPKGQYGAGTVIVWDRGTWEPVGDPREGLDKGKLIFKLHGEKLAGVWELVRISKPQEAGQPRWLLLKKRGDPWARPVSEYDVVTALPDSVVQQPLGPVEEREPRGRAAAAEPGVDLARAVRAALPARLAPQLATLVDTAPASGRWVLESKLDGYRLLARCDAHGVRLHTRNGNDWTTKLRGLEDDVAALGVTEAWLDGEIVVLNEQGAPDFNRLQNAMDNSRTKEVVYFLFDVPFLGGMDLREVPLSSRREVLRELLAGQQHSDRVRFSEAFEASPQELLEAACRMGIEGVMLKRADAPYVSARTDTWLKLKCQRRQEFVVHGFTDRTGTDGEVGSLLLGYHEDGQLRHAGSVGTGWDHATGRELHRLLSRLEVPQPVVDKRTIKAGRWSRRGAGSQRWVQPSTVVEIAFAEWTPDGHVRHASFRGVRTDKPASSIVRERPAGSVPQGAASAPSMKSSIKVTHPERIVDPSTGFRKVELVRYYESIAERMLPHLKDRPVSLVRAPEGIAGQLFFQKHPETRMPGLTELDPELWPGHDALLAVGSAQALACAAQMNVVEFHTWNSTTRRIDQPDLVVFDLDPGEGVPWSQLQEAALLTRALLDELGLASWLKTSGGKGLHVVVPLTPRLDYDAVKGFSQAVVVHMAKTIPQRFVARSGAANRVGKVFIDYLRNGHGQTTVAAFSARARRGLGVSMPVAWDQLAELKGAAQWSIATAREYLSFQQADPWQDYWTTRQTLTRAMKVLGFRPKRRA